MLSDASGPRGPSASDARPARLGVPCGCTPTGMLWIGNERLFCPAARRLREEGLRAIDEGDQVAFDQIRRALAGHVEAALRAREHP